MGSSILQWSNHAWQYAPGGFTLLAIAVIPLLFLLQRLVFPKFDPREPPVLRPKIPVIGHLISMARERTGLYRRLYRDNSLPICTLPMLNGKLYVINSPNLISSAMRSKDLSFDPFVLEFIVNGLGIPGDQARKYTQPDTWQEFFDIIHDALIGENLNKMVGSGLGCFASQLNDIPPNTATEIPDVSIWIRDMMFGSLMKSLYGEMNPMTVEGMHKLQDYEKKVAILALNLAPKILAPRALVARQRLKEIVMPFYAAQHDKGEDVSALIRDRASLQRRINITDEAISRLELIVPWAATTNTIPTTFWIFVHTLSRPEWAKRIRQEIEAIAVITDNAAGRTATINVPALRKECPALLACFHETNRLCNDITGNRRVVRDTILQDPVEGKEYLLTKGTNVQWSCSVTQLDEKVWGPGSEQFDPSRWINNPSKKIAYRKSMIPFGGGKVLCPGRHLAEAEILGFLSGLVLGFEFEGVQVPKMEDPLPGLGMKKLLWDGMDPGVTVRRRQGWEDVKLQFET
ncbi:cytochrome P450 [Ilyonectria robusta]|uniref:cytochrome P450 n=1 Tax=Ilyonectria robusta TaxID=1079257 RepID=UPI001E8CD218|nr:cytochrome P450 [Ilyonectria robusta]KAH8685074.1 cytochrome P450 [Ilyonectria robusta]